MTEFNKTNWARPEFTRQYRDNAEIFIVERGRMFDILKSFYRHFLKDNEKNAILDLGCGDGVVTHELLSVDASLSATLIDASQDMLDKAKDRLTEFGDIDFIRASFQEIIEKDIIQGNFDLVISSMAIHHLTMKEKAALFRTIHFRLNDGGYFVNIDVVLAPDNGLEQWYLELWQSWMADKKASLGIEPERFSDVIMRYKHLEENKPDTLEEQLNELKKLGFTGVDCFYKYGIFSIYGGRKPAAVR